VRCSHCSAPTGAGKTTTVEILEGFRHRDGGEVSVLGVDPGQPKPDWRARMGIVLQATGGHNELTVEELVRHFAGYYPDSRDPDEVMHAVGLDEKRRTRSRHLSGGQRRRLDVALGILGRPELLFLDEPTTGFGRPHGVDRPRTGALRPDLPLAAPRRRLSASARSGYVWTSDGAYA
jgi:ABC-2 type transport system ATP-binding protein